MFSREHNPLNKLNKIVISTLKEMLHLFITFKIVSYFKEIKFAHAYFWVAMSENTWGRKCKELNRKHSTGFGYRH